MRDLSYALGVLSKRTNADSSISLSDVMESLREEFVVPPSILLPNELVVYICELALQGNTLHTNLKLRDSLMAFSGKECYTNFINASNLHFSLYKQLCELVEWIHEHTECMCKVLGSFTAILKDGKKRELRFSFDHASTIDLNKSYIRNLIHHCKHADSFLPYSELTFHRCQLARRRRESPYEQTLIDTIQLGPDNNPQIRVIRFIDANPVRRKLELVFV